MNKSNSGWHVPVASSTTSYKVEIINQKDEVTKGLKNFSMKSEQY